jgi:hypothetical protein
VADDQRCHFDRIAGASLYHRRSLDEAQVAASSVSSKSEDNNDRSGTILNSKICAGGAQNILQKPPTKDET